ncbi:MAG: alpha/beta hydrolase [Myxococcales bacterium]|jgi:pimeloyl-ACP methyl ester carboxylesterase
MPKPKFQMIDTGAITQRVVVKGEGPLVVLVHGWPESWYSWRHQIEPLEAAGYRVAVPDVRGYGGSDKPEAIEAYDLTSLTDDVAGLIDALGEEQAILVGHDWGAPIVWTTAIRHAPKVRAVAGMSVPHLGRGDRPTIEVFEEVYRGRFFYQLYFQKPGVAEAELEADPAATIRKVYYSACGDIRDDERGLSADKGPDAGLLDGLVDPEPLPAWLTEQDVAYYAGEFQRSGFRGPLNRYRNFRRDWEMLPELSEKKVSQPALFIAGTRDPVLSFMPGISLADLMDPWYDDLRAKVMIEGAGHWVQQERPAETNAALLDWLAGLSS